MSIARVCSSTGDTDHSDANYATRKPVCPASPSLPQGYAGKYHLCVDVRIHLVKTGDFAELRPLGFYEDT